MNLLLQYGCILVQGLLEIYDQYKSFCDPFLQEVSFDLALSLLACLLFRTAL
jgi:hypothetical protein